MALLDSRKHIVSAANKDLIYDAEVRQMIEAGKITDVGHDYQPDYEALVHSRPDILFTDGENTGSSQMIGKLKSLGIHIVASRDYFEQEPLARAEWIKFFGAFMDKEQVADSIFDLVKTNYLAVKATADNQKKRPTVFCNLPYNGVWYMPCGQNYAAKIITDAGGDFLWQNEKPINGLNLTLTFEEVYGKAAHADYWINQNTLTSRAQLLGTDPKFELFDAVRKDHIYNGTKRRTKGGGMDIWETGAFLPDLVLKDLSTIFHGSGDQPMNLYYYQQLK
jgi:iron complex transport system substrate-binding protein